MRVTLVRHGDAVAGFSGIVGGERGCAGLTELGRRQAEALRDHLASSERLVADALTTVRAMSTGRVLLRADSAFYGRATLGAAVRAGAQVSVTVRLDPQVKKAIAAIPAQAWTAIEYPDAIFDEDTGAWVSRAASYWACSSSSDGSTVSPDATAISRRSSCCRTVSNTSGREMPCWASWL